MSKLIDRVLRLALVLGAVGALVLGAQAASAAVGVTSCICDPDDPDPNGDCEDCCQAAGSICPSGGHDPRMCICA